MGIRLDWEIEAEKSGTHSATEDPQMALARRAARVRVIFTLIAIVGIFVLIVNLFNRRLSEVDQQIEQLLRETVSAEITALQIGDRQAFLSAQRSADSAWQIAQLALFDDYQQLKTTGDLQLTGTIRDIAIDGTRGRVLVEEILNGVPYVQVWFYWRYEDGWRHVPPDYTFWGEAQQYDGRRVTVSYSGLDQAFAREVGVRVESWINTSCNGVLACGDFPHITIEILNQQVLPEPIWSTIDEWTLQVSSPLIGKARYDQPFYGEVLIAVADLIAKRLVRESSGTREDPVYPNDAYYLRPAVVSWLVGRFVQLNTQSHLITSLALNYGEAKVGELLKRLTPTASIQLFAELTGVENISVANLDWRDYLTWRLQLENELIARTDEAAFIGLYHPQFVQIARDRYQAWDQNATPALGVVQHLEVVQTENGTPQLTALVRYPENEGRIRFWLIDGVWKRAG
ncbi:MAG: hypothetical protein MUF87_22140 [Anaerolineae bacterium]|jgi:hypothetical protein|nr:hypothetical protein [Anaerolineae bacterium]